jgi:hypothetical protein
VARFKEYLEAEKIEQTELGIHISPLLDANSDDIEADVGRIALDSGMCLGNGILIPTKTSATIVWREGSTSLTKIFQAAETNGLVLVSTSKRSVKVIGNYRATEKGIRLCLDMVFGR